VKKLLVHVIAVLPRPVHRALRLARQRSALVRTLTQPLSRSLRSDVFTVRTGAASGLVMNTADGKLGYVFGENEPEVQKTLIESLRVGDVVYDVGANIGFFTLIAARLVGASGCVYAFEPVPQVAEMLRANVELNGFDNVVVIEKAAHSRNGAADLDLSGGTTAAHVVHGDSGEGTLRVETQRLDDLVAARAVRPPALVKIDVEGAERDVLAGMSETVRIHHPLVICELHGSQDEFLAALADFGYAVSVLDDGSDVDNPHVLAVPRASS
jgi:FkbM family methyltransferase